MTCSGSATDVIADRIAHRLAGGFVPDSETISFIKSAYGVIEACEITRFLEHGDDSGAVIDLLSYPDERFRLSIEPLIPPAGLTSAVLSSIEDMILNRPETIFIEYSGARIDLTAEDTALCRRNFIRRLNLDIALDFLGQHDLIPEKTDIDALRCSLRRKRFISNEDCSYFIRDLILNYIPQSDSEAPDLYQLTDAASDFFNRSEINPYDILSSKKFFYESAISESEEFARMMKTYSMEFIMMKRIQPPLVTLEDARRMVRMIDIMTWSVYRIIIPSVNVSFYKSSD